MNITLPPALDRIVRDKVKAGLYASGSELVCEPLRREFARDPVHEWVRAQVADGFTHSMLVRLRNFSRRTDGQAGSAACRRFMHLRFSRLTLDDIALIHDYTVGEWGEEQALKYVGALARPPTCLPSEGCAT